MFTTPMQKWVIKRFVIYTYIYYADVRKHPLLAEYFTFSDCI